MLKTCLTCYYWDMDIIKKGVPTEEKCLCKESLNHNKTMSFNDHCICWTSPID
jgi:hypothetical protein